MDQKRKFQKNIGKVLFLSSSWTFLILMPIIVPFFKSLGLQMEQIFMLQSFYAFVVVVCEIPSGYISDLLGRKNTLIVACLFHGIGFSFFPFVSDLGGLMVAEFFLGVGVSLFSGTDIALIYDSIEAEGEIVSLRGLMGKMVFYQQASESMAALFTTFLISVSFNFPVLIQACISWIPFLVALTLVEPTRKKMSTKRHGENLKYIFKALFKKSYVLTLILFNGMAYGVTTLLAVWTYQAFWGDLGIPLTSFGLLWAISNIIVAFMGRSSNRFEKWFGTRNAFLVMGVLPIIGWAAMGVTAYYKAPTLVVIIGIGLSFLHQVCRGISQVLLKDMLNQSVETEMRATANSFKSFGVRGLFIFWGPGLGFLMDHNGGSTAFFVMSGIYVLCFGILCVPLIQNSKRMPYFTRPSSEIL